MPDLRFGAGHLANILNKAHQITIMVYGFFRKKIIFEILFKKNLEWPNILVRANYFKIYKTSDFGRNFEASNIFISCQMSK